MALVGEVDVCSVLGADSFLAAQRKILSTGICAVCQWVLFLLILALFDQCPGYTIPSFLFGIPKKQCNAK